MLTADPSNIGDPDGIADADFEYQWIAFDGTTDSDISGATGETYRPLLAHLAQTIKVRVTFNDDNDNAESLTSAATAAVTASTYGQVIWAATLTVEEYTVSGTGTFFGFSLFENQGSLEPFIFSHDGNSTTVNTLWYLEGAALRFNITGSLGSEDFSLYLDGAPFLIESPGTSSAIRLSDHGLTWTDEQEVEVRLTVNRAATGAPAVTGTPEVGETLTADISAIMDEDGVPAADQFTYQWVRSDGTDDRDIDGATDSTYAVVQADAGKSIKVRVSFTDDAKFPESLTSAATAAVTVPVAALVSNVGQTSAGTANVTATQSQGQGFTTESDSGGYTLGSVELGVSSFSGTASDITVSIYSESSGNPGTLVHTLTTPASISTPVTTFTAPSGTTLAAGTTYYVVISTTGSGINLSRTNATAEDTGGVSGWSIADDRRFAQAGAWNTTTRPIRMRVNGAAATTTSTAIWSATLTVAEFTIDPDTYRGYTQAGIGDLDPLTFSHDGNEITVNNLWYIVGGLLTFQISQELGGEGFLLRLGETLLPLGEPTDDPPAYRFSDHGVSWSVGDTVEVRLIPNQAATGAPVITGTAQVGETLTADTDGIGDPDGIDNADFSYQWVRNDDSDIDGATDSTYTLVFADYGNTIKVRVSFTDDNDFPESLTSTAVAVASPYGDVIHSALLTVGIGGLFSGYSSISGDGDLEPANFTHNGNPAMVQILAYSGNEFYFQTLPALGSGDYGPILDDTPIQLGAASGSPARHQVSDHGLTWTADQQVEVWLVLNNEPTGEPVITGTPVVSQTLTADISGIMDTDGRPADDHFSYQWIRNDGTDDSDISGATNATYKLGSADLGKTIKVRVTFTDGGGFPETLTSDATGPVTPLTVSSDWSLVPSSLNPGDRFRLMFLTTSRNATPKDIDVYNEWVQGRAAGGHDAIREYAEAFNLLGCTEDVAARDNTGTTYTDDDKGVRIYWLNGPKVVDDYEDLYDGDWDEEAKMRTRSGTERDNPEYVWTGCGHNGTVSSGAWLGHDKPTVGLPDGTEVTGGPLSSSLITAKAGSLAVYALSDVFEVAVPTTEVPADWSLVPSGLQEGDQFRLLFISSTSRNASPSAIATYNTWVQDLAASGHTDIQDYSSSFRAVGSTEDMDARDNTGTTYTSSDKGVAIYWLGGNKVADDYEDFYDEDWDEEASMTNESGTAESGVTAWTGSDHDGTEMLQGTPETSRALGNSGNHWVRYGKTNSDSHGPLSGETANRSNNRRIYGLSSVFEVVVGNNPATGEPTISGTAQVGGVLTADTSNIGDPDGIADATFSYQWIADDGTTGSDIDGATGETYWPSAGDVGNTIKVKVSFTDDEDNAESVTSAATGAVAGPAVTAVPADWSLIPDGLDAGDRFRLLFVSSTFRDAVPTDIGAYNTWIQNRVDAGHADIQDYTETFRAVGCTAAVDARGDTGTTYTSDDKGVPIYWLNGDNAADEYEDFYDETWDEEASMRDESGTTVSAPGSVWTGCEHDGTEGFGGGRSEALGNNTGVVFGEPNSDATNAGPLSSSTSSSRTVSRPLYGLSGVFSVSPPGEILYSATLTVGEETFLDTYLGYHSGSNQGSLHPVFFTYAGSHVGVFELSYLVGGDLVLDVSAPGGSLLSSGSFNLYLDGAAFLIENPASDSDGVFEFSGHGLSWTNGQIVRVWLTENREPKLTISGTTLVGQTLTATIDEPDGLPPSDQITYQWIRVDGNTESDISGETGSTYTLVDADEDKTIKVEASYTDNANFAESLTSDASAVISSGPGVGTVTSGMITQTSAVITVTIANPDTNSQTVNLQYKRNADTNWTSVSPRSTVSAAVTFTLSSLTGNTDYDVRASLDSNFASGVVTATFKTSPVKPAPPTGVDITTEGNGELTVGWTAPTENGGSAITGYKVQWKSGTQSFGPARQQAAGASATSHNVPSLTNGTLYTVRVLAVNSVGDSAASNTDTGTPSTTPSAPTNVQASGNAELAVTWDAPDDGGSAITGYKVQWKSGTQNYNTTSRQATVTTTTHTIPSLTNDTTYTLLVKATNANGDSGWTEITGTPVSGPGVASETVDQASITQTSAAVTVTVANRQDPVHLVYLRYRVAGDA